MKLYKQNLYSGLYDLSFDEILKKFLESDFNKNVVHSDNSVLNFIAAPDGLNSSFDVLSEEERKEFYAALNKYRNKINYYFEAKK